MIIKDNFELTETININYTIFYGFDVDFINNYDEDDSLFIFIPKSIYNSQEFEKINDIDKYGIFVIEDTDDYTKLKDFVIKIFTLQKEALNTYKNDKIN
jgi:hypothetical protein